MHSIWRLKCTSACLDNAGQILLTSVHARLQRSGLQEVFASHCSRQSLKHHHLPGASIAKAVFETPSEPAIIRSRRCLERYLRRCTTNGLKRRPLRCDDGRPKSDDRPIGSADSCLCEHSIVMPPFGCKGAASADADVGNRIDANLQYC